MLKLRPNFATTVRSDLEKWWELEYVERLIDGLRKAGLESRAVRSEPTSASAHRALLFRQVGVPVFPQLEEPEGLRARGLPISCLLEAAVRAGRT